jgi:hypothetical protein
LKKIEKIGFNNTVKALVKKLETFKKVEPSSADACHVNYRTRTEQKPQVETLPVDRSKNQNKTLSFEASVENFRQLVLENSPLSFLAQRIGVAEKEGSAALAVDELHKKLGYWNTYQFKAYEPKIAVFRAKEQPPGYYQDSFYGWEKIAKGNLEICDIPTFHVEVVESKVTAQSLKVCLEKAVDQ